MVYHHESVKKACLAFQDEEHANVNALLLCCWLAYAVEEVSRASLLKACHSIDNWNKHVTQSLRSTRRWVKSIKRKDPWVDEFVQQLVLEELVSETYQQFQLFSCFEKKLKKKAGKNKDQACIYLSWLFSDIQGQLDTELEKKIRLFVRLVFSKVAMHE